MICTKIDLYKHFGVKRKKGALGYLNTYIPQTSPELGLKRRRPAMIVFPGGAYQYISEREKEPIAVAFLERGYCAFTLDYSIKTLGFPTQLVEACMAVAYVRQNAETFAVDTEHIGAVGFSAGGHVVGTLATMYNDEAVIKALGEGAADGRPDAVILAYAVLTGNPQYWHAGSIKTVSLNKKTLMAKMSIEKHVNQDSVPAFIWHTKEDGAVPVQNSLFVAEAYAEHGVPFEIHVFERGVHGLSLATPETAVNDMNRLCNPNVAVWINLADNWLKMRGFRIRNEQ